MANIPMKFKRVSEAFDDMARGIRLCHLCESSGSDHPVEESSRDLSDLVNSFIERETICEYVTGNDNEEHFNFDDDEEDKKEKEEQNGLSINDDLMRLLRIEDDDDGVKMSIHAAVEKACFDVGDFSSSPASFKRRLMALLREQGIDAGICKSKWEKKCGCPSGTHDYIDVISNSKRFIIEVSLASQFEIARSTEAHVSLLQFFPQIFVGEVQEIEKIARLMCNSIKASMKRGGISVPPWRRLAYMKEKWLGPYKRTINNEVPKASKALDEDLAAVRSIGFVAGKSPISYRPREYFRSRDGRKVGNLASVLAAG